MTEPSEDEKRIGIPCGGCGATADEDRCIGCLHDFGTPESAWVNELAALIRAHRNQGDGK